MPKKNRDTPKSQLVPFWARKAPSKTVQVFLAKNRRVTIAETMLSEMIEPEPAPPLSEPLVYFQPFPRVLAWEQLCNQCFKGEHGGKGCGWCLLDSHGEQFGPQESWEARRAREKKVTDAINAKVATALRPYMIWDASGSFRTQRDYTTQAMETVAHELGHIFHLEDILTDKEHQLFKEDIKGLRDFIFKLPPPRRVQNECEARAVNHLIAKDIPDAWQWVGEKAPSGADKPTDEELLAQAANPKTIAIAARIKTILAENDLLPANA